MAEKTYCLTKDAMIDALKQMEYFLHYDGEYADFNNYVSPSGERAENIKWYGWRLSIDLTDDTFYSDFVESDPDYGQEPITYEEIPYQWRMMILRDLRDFERALKHMGFEPSLSAAGDVLQALNDKTVRELEGLYRGLLSHIAAQNVSGAARVQALLQNAITDWIINQPQGSEQ